MGLPVYNVGTASVANGNQAVTLAGGAALTSTDPTTGALLAVCGPGDQFIVPGSGGGVGVIQSVNSPTSITLETPWAGSTNAAATYKIYRQSVPLTGSAAALAQQLLDQGSDSAADLSRTIDSGVARVKLRIGSDGLAQLAVGATGAADASLLAGIEIDPATGNVSMPNGFKEPVTGRRNPHHNAAFEIWQRGTSLTVAGGTNVVTADRWNLGNVSGVTATVSKAASPSGFSTPNCLLWTAPSVAAGANIDIAQKFEGASLARFDSKACTVSFDINAVTTAGSLTGAFYILGNTALDNGTFSTLVCQVSFTVPVGTKRVSIPLSAAQTIGLKNGASFGYRLVQTSATGTPTVYFGAAEIELGTAPTPFEYFDIAIDRLLCERAYRRLSLSGLVGVVTSATQITFTARLQGVGMRVAPSAVLLKTAFNQGSAELFIANNLTGGTGLSLSSPQADTKGISFSLTGWSGLTVGQVAVANNFPTGQDVLELISEL